MRPFYSVYFNARMCYMKISVNGIPLLGMEVRGQCSSRYPFNNLLLGSGWATITYEALPLKGEARLHKDAFLSCKVELYDLDSNYEPLLTMASFETREDMVTPFVAHRETFQVDVPYNLIGWKHSVKLDQLEGQMKDQLKLMVAKKYHSIITMMRNHDFSRLENAFREREAIMGVCFYLTEDEKHDRMKALEEVIMNCSEVALLSRTDRLEFASDGRLVRLIKMDRDSALRLRNNESGEETMIDLWLHMKHGSQNLSII